MNIQKKEVEQIQEAAADVIINNFAKYKIKVGDKNLVFKKESKLSYAIKPSSTRKAITPEIGVKLKSDISLKSEVKADEINLAAYIYQCFLTELERLDIMLNIYSPGEIQVRLRKKAVKLQAQYDDITENLVKETDKHGISNYRHGLCMNHTQIDLFKLLMTFLSGNNPQ